MGVILHVHSPPIRFSWLAMRVKDRRIRAPGFRMLVVCEPRPGSRKRTAARNQDAPNEQVRAVAQAQKDLFSGKRMQQQLQVTSNGVLLNSQETLEKWLNAYEYHRDKGKKAQLDALHKILPIEFSIPLFLSLLIDRAAAVLDLADLVGLIIGKTEKFEGPGC